MPGDDLQEKILENIDGSRRAFVRKMISGPFVAPLITSFAMTGLAVQDANARVSNLSPGPAVPTLGPLARIILPGALLAAGLFKHKVGNLFGRRRDDDKNDSIA